MSEVTPTSGTEANERYEHEGSTDARRAAGGTLLLAAATFFLGSGVLTQSGQPGASTPVPWMVSHAVWVVATALVAVGAVLVIRRVPAIGETVAGSVAAGAFGLATLHAAQWAAWVYVDIVAYRRGAHESLLEPLLHPFGVGHMLVFGVLVGSGVAALAWALAQAEVTHRITDVTGFLVGASTVLAATSSLALVEPIRSPIGLATIALVAVAFAWLAALGLTLYRT